MMALRPAARVAKFFPQLQQETNLLINEQNQ
jgi:hypothetical protein